MLSSLLEPTLSESFNIYLSELLSKEKMKISQKSKISQIEKKPIAKTEEIYRKPKISQAKKKAKAKIVKNSRKNNRRKR
jgi:hypothetical protein